MKRIASILAFAMFTISVAQAQTAPEKKSREQRKEMKEEMEKAVGLSPAQSKEMNALNKKYAEQLKAVREDQVLTPDQKKEKAKTINSERESKINEMLSPDQQEKWKKWREDQKAERKDKKSQRK
jgi:periplasmic protein CpxP/Spy